MVQENAFTSFILGESDAPERTRSIEIQEEKQNSRQRFVGAKERDMVPGRRGISKQR